MNTKTRVEIADEIALAVIVFVRQARSEGYSNRITEMAIIDSAAARGYETVQWNLKTAKRRVRERLTLTHETDLISF